MSDYSLLPDFLYRQGQLQSGVAVHIESGRIAGLGPALPNSVRLPGQLLLPGLINSHSHSFQRVIRGSTEYRRAENPTDDFWSWRELMYQAAMGLSPEGLEAVSRLVFLEMVTSGITCVGEFHYLHYQADGTPYADPDELAHRVIAAARWAGLKIVLLRVAYHRAGFAQPANPRQIRFLDHNAEQVLQAAERLRASGVPVGIAPHSLRAVPRDWLPELGEYARRHGLPLHMHVAEQPREVEECLAEHQLRPVQLLAEMGVLGPTFTGVHLIHLSQEELYLLGNAEATACSCPTTERNLGDGIVGADDLLRRGARISLGTDSQCQIDLLEDARQLEYHLRLSHRQRAILDPVNIGGAPSLAAQLLECATSSGARSLGVEAGALEAGRAADFLSVNLEHPALVGCRDPLAAVVFGLPLSAIQQVWVDGQALLQDGRHPKSEEAVRGFRTALKDLQLA